MRIEVKEDIRYLATFSKRSGEKIGERDHWSCKGPGGGEPCILIPVIGKPANFFDGYMVQKSHVVRGSDSPDNGVIRCITCHWHSHKIAGEDDFASLIEKSDILTEEARINPSNFPLAIFSLRNIFDVIGASEAKMFRLGLADIYEADEYFRSHPEVVRSSSNQGVIRIFR